MQAMCHALQRFDGRLLLLSFLPFNSRPAMSWKSASAAPPMGRGQIFLPSFLSPLHQLIYEVLYDTGLMGMIAHSFKNATPK